MSTQEFTLVDLKRILLEGAGADEGVDLDSDTALTTDFVSLGYDSLALLETGGRIEREYGVSLDEEIFANGLTPNGLLTAVNASIQEAAVA
ncbi:acyl carrier protein [Streptomyces globisporus]|uniref:Acyl carrier protein n=1 Tax=Streptomyces globisporus TaxID=1908 RepID=A0A068ELV9_STRGL|nr:MULTISPECIES: acyl carrier protein [Streptomyces]AID46992.1 acyl carrier protein [Streptomyces globisporus]ROV69881.1 acyl carrier protein [Streptomyces globisporus]